MTSCSILKKNISKARTKKARGKALGAYAKARCFRKRRKSKR